jgi:hypothetical protein
MVKYMKKCSKSLIIRKVKIKTTRYPIPVKMAIILKRPKKITMVMRMWIKGSSCTP